MEKAFYVQPRGTSEGLALWWKEETNVQILFANPNMIGTIVWMKNLEFPMYMTWVHADTNDQLRNQNKNELRRIWRMRTGKWVCQGDFNAITNHHEKE